MIGYELLKQCLQNWCISMWRGHEAHTDPASAKSCIGFIITFVECCVFQQSKLQWDTALHMMEAKIIALPACCRELFPIIDMVRSWLRPLIFQLETQPWMSLYMELIEEHWCWPRLCFCSLLLKSNITQAKWFGSAKKIFKRDVQLNNIDTVKQLREIFTKGLTGVIFECLQKKIMKWLFLSISH